MDKILIAVLTVGGIGLVAAVLLTVAAHFMSVKSDEKEKKLRECLPGANCGACGYTGCDGYAKALASGKESATNLCVPGADSVSRRVSDVLGVPFMDVIEQVAFVHCHGDCFHNKDKEVYEGINTCSAANMLFGGRGACTQGCLGYGDCAAVCPVGAICIKNGIAHVDTRRCIGCGKCAKVCPNRLISMFADVRKVVITCSNREKGAIVRKKCSNGCIGCMKCEKGCPADAVHVINHCAKIDYEKCISCGKCASECPVGCIEFADFSGAHRTDEE